MKNKEKQLLHGSIVAFGVSAGSFLLFPADWLWKIPGILFWVGLFAGCTLQFLLSQERRMGHKGKEDHGSRRKNRPGIICFFSNRKAFVADIVFLPAVIGFIITERKTYGIGYLGYVFLSVALFAFFMHCVFNSRNYEYVCQKKYVGKKKTVREEGKIDEK